jgi:hypothetical protein
LTFCWRAYLQICRPVRASSARTTPGCVVYMTPSATTGIASRTESPGIGNAHAVRSWFTFVASICFRPE